MSALRDIVERLANARSDLSLDEWCRISNRLLSVDAEIERLLEVERAARRYYERYCQDEADESEWVCGEEQRRDAQALRDALRAPVPTTEGREP